MKDTTTIHQEAISFGCVHHTKRQVLLHLLHQAITQVTRGDEFSIFSEERRVVDREQHVHRRLIHRNAWQCFRIFRIGDRISDIEILDTHHGAKITGMYFSYFFLTHPLEYIQFFHTATLGRTIGLHEGDRLIFFDHTATYFSYGNTSEERRIVE